MFNEQSRIIVQVPLAVAEELNFCINEYLFFKARVSGEVNTRNRMN